MADRSVNKAILIGNLGRDPELRHTASGQAVATFTVATNRSWTSPDGTANEETEWHNIVAWARLAEICQQYLQKGRKVYIEGRIQTRSWDDAKTGHKRYMTEIVANQMIILDAPGGSRGDASGRGAARERGAQAGGAASSPGAAVDWPEADDQDDDLPF
ncbi:MAG TPA: single-stranded DNA-binding protein [Gemmatimonadota bacterium]|nr:single-stranded DNA-binding protein [Gemmatimonadota bacterium]